MEIQIANIQVLRTTQSLLEPLCLLSITKHIHKGTLIKLYFKSVSEKAQQVKVPTAKSDNLSSFPGSQMVERQN